MKYLLLITTLWICGTSFAQDTVTLVLSNVHGMGMNDAVKPDFARLEVSRRVYELTKSNPKIELVCKYSKDKDVQMGISKGQVYAFHKAYQNGAIKRCNTSAVCSARKFEDLASKDTIAVTSPMLSGEWVNNYRIESADSWKEVRDRRAGMGYDHWKYAELDNLPLIDTYSPKKHGKTLPAPVNGFTCAVADFASRKYLEP